MSDKKTIPMVQPEQRSCDTCHYPVDHQEPFFFCKRHLVREHADCHRTKSSKHRNCNTVENNTSIEKKIEKTDEEKEDDRKKNIIFKKWGIRM